MKRFITFISLSVCSVLFLSSVCVIFMMFSFNSHKCVHVFTSVEPDTVKIKPFTIVANNSSIKEGKELICIKCLYRQKQVLDYLEIDSSVLHELNRHYLEFIADTIKTK